VDDDTRRFFRKEQRRQASLSVVHGQTRLMELDWCQVRASPTVSSPPLTYCVLSVLQMQLQRLRQPSVSAGPKSDPNARAVAISRTGPPEPHRAHAVLLRACSKRTHCIEFVANARADKSLSSGAISQLPRRGISSPSSIAGATCLPFHLRDRSCSPAAQGRFVSGMLYGIRS
jgi:hypothetical protein